MLLVSIISKSAGSARSGANRRAFSATHKRAYGSPGTRAYGSAFNRLAFSVSSYVVSTGPVMISMVGTGLRL
jgi:hypothetical protein